MPSKYLFNPWEAPKEVLESAGVELGKLSETHSRLKDFQRYCSRKPLLQQRKIIMNDPQINDLKDVSISWTCRHTWKRSSINTLWCLLGCSIGDFGTILFFQINEIAFPMLGIMTLAVINGLITSIILETIILSRQMNLRRHYTARGMSNIHDIYGDCHEYR